MKYQNGSYSSSENLLQVVKEKLVTEGWIVDLHAYVNSGDTSFGKRLHVHRDDVYVSMRNFDDYNPSSTSKITGYGKTGIDFRVSAGFSESQVWNQQPGYSNYSRCVKTDTSGIYHLFTDDAKVLLIVEYETGRYSHVIFGSLNVYVAGTGGQFLSANLEARDAAWDKYNWKVPFDTYAGYTSVRVSKSDFQGWIISYEGSSGTGICASFFKPNLVRVPNFSPGSSSVGGIGSSARSSNRLNGLSALMPIYTYVKHENMWSPFAEFDDLYFVNCDLMIAEQDYVVGNQTFKIFPFFGKEIPAVKDGPLFQLGFAVKVDV